ncbi:MAG: DUF3445 domain-containing protein [bacterium]
MIVSLIHAASATGAAALCHRRPAVSEMGSHPAALLAKVPGNDWSLCLVPPILQSRLPFAPWMADRTARLPGVQPVEGTQWLQVDDAFAGQMALRDRLIAEQPDVVLAALPGSGAATEELLQIVLQQLQAAPGYTASAASVTRPDRIEVEVDRTQPLKTLGRLVQEDLCLLQHDGTEHVLTAAALCFPASWSLHEKLGRPLTGVHRTVAAYDDGLAKRVQRLFDLVRVGQPLWRANALIYVNPDLHQPGSEFAPRTERRNGTYVRSERQTILRLPETGAIVFAIHSYVVPLDSLSAAERAGLVAARL